MRELYAVDDPEYCEFLLGVYREVATRGGVAPLKASLRPVDKAYRMAGSLLLPLDAARGPSRRS